MRKTLATVSWKRYNNYSTRNNTGTTYVTNNNVLI